MTLQKKKLSQIAPIKFAIKKCHYIFFESNKINFINDNGYFTMNYDENQCMIQ